MDKYANEGIGLTPMREAQVDVALTKLESNLGYLSETITVLEKKLDRVLRLQPTTGEGNAKEADSVVPLANAIRMSANKAGALNIKLNEILERIEL